MSQISGGYSGLSYAQFNSLLSPVKSTCFSEIGLFFRRLVHLLLHQEWMTDAKLINRLYTHVKSPNCRNDSEVNNLFQRVCAGTHSQIEKGTFVKLQEMKEVLKSPAILPYFIDSKELKSPFSIDLWALGHNPKHVGNSKEVINLELEKYDAEAIQAILSNLESSLSSNLERLRSHPRYKPEYSEKVTNSFHAILDYYRALLAHPSETQVPLKPQERLDALKSVLCEIEADMGITGRFKEHVNRMVDAVLQQDPSWQAMNPNLKNRPKVTSQALARDLRICRKYIIDRRIYERHYFGKMGMGNHVEIFDFLKKVLDPNCDVNVTLAGRGNSRIENDHLLVHYQRTGNTKLVQACFEQIGHHFVSYVYTKQGGDPYFAPLDNLRPSKQKRSVEQMQEVTQTKGGVVGHCYNMAVNIENLEDLNSLRTPHPETWLLPAWERNNCFMATALVELALVQFYACQKNIRERGR